MMRVVNNLHKLSSGYAINADTAAVRTTGAGTAARSLKRDEDLTFNTTTDMDTEGTNNPLAILTGEKPLEVRHGIDWRTVAVLSAALIAAAVVAALIIKK